VCKITLCKIASPCCHITCPYLASLGRPAMVMLSITNISPSCRMDSTGWEHQRGWEEEPGFSALETKALCASAHH